MIYLGLALMLLGFATVGTATAVWLLAASQVILLMHYVLQKQLTGTGAFIFMSFLFFGMRPIYLIVEDDYRLFTHLFHIQADLTAVGQNMFWGTVAMFAFALGSIAIRQLYTPVFRKRAAREFLARPPVPTKLVRFILFYQLISLPVMMYLAGGGRALYGSGLGAYGYELPVPLQAGHIFGMVVIFERYLRHRRTPDLLGFGASVVLFLVFTWFMREVSMFRGFYIAGVMIGGIALLQRLKIKVSYAWLIVPIVLFQPLFQMLGTTRQLDNEQLSEVGIVQETFEDRGILEAYWDFYSSSGDMNIFDTFVAARASRPAVQPYIKSWLYVPVHVVPRMIWQQKPQKGVLQDLRFMYGAPYAPGLAGFFWLDGGSDWWMLICMLALGGIIGYLDGHVLSMREGYLKACLLGILVVNAMFLTRFFLWQAFWQAAYAAVPCILLAYLFRDKRKARVKQIKATQNELAVENRAVG